MRKDGISEADLRTAIQNGLRIGLVLLVHRDTDKPFVPCIRFVGQRRWRVLRMRRYEASRSWNTFQAVQTFLAEHGYQGPVVVLRESDPILARREGIADL